MKHFGAWSSQFALLYLSMQGQAWRRHQIDLDMVSEGISEKEGAVIRVAARLVQYSLLAWQSQAMWQCCWDLHLAVGMGTLLHVVSRGSTQSERLCWGQSKSASDLWHPINTRGDWWSTVSNLNVSHLNLLIFFERMLSQHRLQQGAERLHGFRVSLGSKKQGKTTRKSFPITVFLAVNYHSHYIVLVVSLKGVDGH